MVPEGWYSERLGKLSDTITSGSRDWAKYYSETGSKFIRMTNLPRHGINLKLDDLKFVNVSHESSDGKRTALRSDDILISITAELGKIGLVPEDLGEAFINQHTALVRLKSEFSYPKFIAYYLSSQPVNHRINRLNDSGAKAGLNLSTIRTISLTLPPLPEQKKIAKILQTWDRAIATTEKLIDASKRQKKALMQQLLTGKKRFAGFEGEWEVVSLGEVCKVSGGKRLPKGNTLQPTPNNHPYLRVTDMKMGGIDESNLLYVPDEVAPTISRYRVQSNDLFITVAGTLGLVGKVPCSLNGANLTENADKLTDIKCNPDYLLYSMMSPSFQKAIDNVATQNAQPKLALSRIRSFEVSLPCREEQRQIAAAIQNSVNEIEIHKGKLANLKQEKKALMQQLLTGKRRVKVDG